MTDPSGIYRRRFDDEDAAKKDRMWVPIARYLQRFVPEDGRVIDVGCDRGDFIRNVRAAEKWAAETSAAFALHEVPGPHLFLQDAAAQVSAHVRAAF